MRASSFTIVIVALALFSVHAVTESKFLLVEIQKGSANVHEKAVPPADDRNTNTSTIKSEGDDRKSFDPFKPSAGRSTSRRSYKSPLERSFCNLINRDTRYDVCVVDCKSNWNGGVQGCTETVWEKKCGCNEGPPKVVGVMKYKDGRLINDEIDSPGCRAQYRNNRCESCYRGSGWRAESYATWTDSKCGENIATQRCFQWEPSDDFSTHDGRPFGGYISDNHCRKRYDIQGNEERFCEVKCHYDGSCTETVKQNMCTCSTPENMDEDEFESEARSDCATVEYKDGTEVQRHGNITEEAALYMFSVCDRNSYGVRCKDCRSDEIARRDMSGTYLSYDYNTSPCPHWRNNNL